MKIITTKYTPWAGAIDTYNTPEFILESLGLSEEEEEDY